MTEVAWIVMGLWSATKVLEIIVDSVHRTVWDRLEKANERNFEVDVKIEKLERQIEELKK